MTQDLMSIAASRIDYLAQTQNVLAQNIANIDTPGYSPRTPIRFADMLDGSHVSMSLTHPDDIAPVADNTVGSEDATVAERAPDGNAVSLDQELAAVARTQINQQYAVNIYKSYLGMFNTALGPSI
ncbi:MAG: flagellar basal body protein [Acidiphilium sp.]|jgi:flagellar basal-body rod protein FlgB|nr:flagellar basal body protein [Acidiphilium sp.]